MFWKPYIARTWTASIKYFTLNLHPPINNKRKEKKSGLVFFFLITYITLFSQNKLITPAVILIYLPYYRSRRKGFTL